MRDHKGAVRGFTHLSKCWYGDACVNRSDEIDSITMGFYHPEGGTSGEFSIKWEMLGGRQAACLTSFADSWDTLNNFADVVAALSDFDDGCESDPTPDEVAQILINCGIDDLSKTESPYK